MATPPAGNRITRFLFQFTVHVWICVCVWSWKSLHWPHFSWYYTSVLSNTSSNQLNEWMLACFQRRQPKVRDSRAACSGLSGTTCIHWHESSRIHAVPILSLTLRVSDRSIWIMNIAEKFKYKLCWTSVNFCCLCLSLSMNLWLKLVLLKMLASLSS